MTMADLSKREAGWYWVTYHSDKSAVACWNGDEWLFAGSELPGFDSHIKTVVSRIHPPVEDRERDELVAALRELLNAIKEDQGPREYRGRIGKAFIAARAALAKADASAAEDRGEG